MNTSTLNYIGNLVLPENNDQLGLKYPYQSERKTFRDELLYHLLEDDDKMLLYIAEIDETVHHMVVEIKEDGSEIESFCLLINGYLKGN